MKSKVILKAASTFVILFVILDILMIEFNLRDAIFKSVLVSEDYRYLTLLIPMGLFCFDPGPPPHSLSVGIGPVIYAPPIRCNLFEIIGTKGCGPDECDK
jgi:hypothetical protein